MLHIGIDGYRLTKSRYKGTEHYSYELINNLFRVAPHHRFTIYVPHTPTKKMRPHSAQVEWKFLPTWKLFNYTSLSWAMLKGPQPDIIFFPDQVTALVTPKKVVATVHDIAFKTHPENYTFKERIFHNFSFTLLQKKATHIIAISQYTEKEIVQHSSIPKKNISVIYHGCDHELFRPRLPSEPIPHNIQALMPYLYFVGRLEAKKNTVKLIEAFKIIKTKFAIPHKLVLAGSFGYQGVDKIKQILAQLDASIRQAIVLPGHVSDQDNQLLMRHAEIFVFPSHVEGFGMPLVEAMAAGIPTVASNTSSIPEIAGNASILVNQTSAQSIAEGIMTIIQNPNRRAELVSRGLSQAKKFSWERTALDTIKVIEETAKL